MNIALPEHRTLKEVVTIVISMCMAGADYEQVQLSLVEEVGLSADDAALTWDRVHGGIVRASTRHRGNCPNRSKDPLACLSFERAMEDLSIIAVLYPQYAKPLPIKILSSTEPALKKRAERADSTGPKRWWKLW